jgi:hypothetical protein
MKFNTETAKSVAGDQDYTIKFDGTMYRLEANWTKMVIADFKNYQELEIYYLPYGVYGQKMLEGLAMGRAMEKAGL